MPGVLDAIQNGLAQWSIAQNPYAQGWVTSALIHMAIENGYPPFSYDTGAEVVDASNIDAVAEREAQFEVGERGPCTPRPPPASGVFGRGPEGDRGLPVAPSPSRERGLGG